MCGIHRDKKEFKSRLSESARSKILVTMHLSYTCEQTNKCLHAVMPTVDITKKNAMDHSSTNFFFFCTFSIGLCRVAKKYWMVHRCRSVVYIGLFLTCI